jgi:hypothetical protein
VSCSTVECRARSFFLSSRQHYLAGATLGQQGAERDLRYFCTFEWMPVHLFSDSSPSVAEKRTSRPCHIVYQMGRCALPTGWGPENAPFMLSDGKDVMGLSRGPPANLVAE